MAEVIYTVGHSRHGLEEFLTLLERHGIRLLSDIRRFPSSRKFPHFGKEALSEVLKARGIEYLGLPQLGGRRRPRPDSVNTALTSPGFRGYADHMQTEEFQEALSVLLEAARRKTTAVMCAEGLPWRCHRWFLADLLILRGFTVLHILPDGNLRPHRLHPLARKEGRWVVYPALNLSKCG